MATTRQPTIFPLYRCTNPQTNCESSFIAVAEDGSAVLEIGNYSLCVDWDVTEESATWLAKDFVPTGQSVSCDFSMLHEVIAATFGDKVDFLALRFGTKLQPKGMELSLIAQKAAEDGPEYRIDGVGRYRRIYRIPWRTAAVTLAEQAVIDVGVELANEVAATWGSELKEPPPLRWRSSSAHKAVDEGGRSVGEKEA